MAHHGGSWKVAYADFATAMMALFLVLWVTGQDQQVKEAIASHFREPGGVMPDVGSGPLPVPDGAFPGIPDAAHVPPGAAPESASRGRNRRAATVPRKKGPACRGVVFPFDEDTAELDAAARTELDALLPMILGKPHRIEIRGHSSGRRLPAGSPYADAWELSYVRCIATMIYLTDRGVDPRRLRLSQGGEFEPQTRQRGSSAQALNSRVEVTILTEWIDGFGEIRNEQGQPIEQPDNGLLEQTLPVLVEPADTQ